MKVFQSTVRSYIVIYVTILILLLQALKSALRKNLNEDERKALLHQIELLKNVNLDLVNTIISSIHTNDDDIILVLGVLARNNNFTIQKVITDELSKRLNMVLSSSNIETSSTLIYALGNSGSKLAIFSLLSTLKYDNVDIKICVIRSLALYLDQPVVQQAIISLLPSADEEKILEEILKILIDAFYHKILTNPSEELVSTIINSAAQLEDPNLYELLVKYLHLLKINENDVYLDLLKQPHDNGELKHHINGTSRVKRGSDWDQSYSGYDVVASLHERRNDVTMYPHHRAYIWGKTFGGSKLNLKIGAGAFAGLYVSSTTVRGKIYSKVAAKVNVFGISINVVDIQSNNYISNGIQISKIYVKQGNSVHKNDNKQIKLDSNPTRNTIPLSNSRKIFHKNWPIFVYVGTLNVYIEGRLTYGVNIGTDASASYPPPTMEAGISAKFSFGLRVSGGTYASLLVSLM